MGTMATTTIQSVGERLRALRRERNLSVNALARMARCSAWHIVLCERHCLIPPSDSVRERIAGVLGVSSEWLFSEGGEGA